MYFNLESLKMRKHIKTGGVVIAVLTFGLPLCARADDANSLYLHQSGSGSTIAIIQNGDSNIINGVGSEPNTLFSDGQGNSLVNLGQLIGDAQTIAITQTGPANSLQLNFTSANGALTFTAAGNTTAIVDISGGSDNDYSYAGSASGASGNSVQVNSTIRGGGGNTIAIVNGNDATSSQVFNTTINGVANTTSIAISGLGEIVNTIQGMGVVTNPVLVPVNKVGGAWGAGTLSGLDPATFGVGSKSYSGQITINSITGNDYNTFNVGQADTGAGSNIAWINLNAGSSDNGISVAQSGTVQNIVSLDLTGSANLMNVVQTSGSGSSQTNTAVIVTSGSNNSWSINQRH